MVGARLGNDYHAYHGYAVHLHVTLDVGGAQFGAADVAEADDAVAVLFDDEVVKLLGGVHQAQGTDGQLCGVALDTSRRQLDVFPVYGTFHVDRCDAVARHLGGVEPQAHGVFFLAPDADAAHVRDGLQLFLHRKVGNLAQLKQRAFVALERHHQDGGGVGVGFRYGGRVAVVGQVALCARHLVAHVVGGGFQVDRQLEFYCDAALPLLADAGKRADAGNTVDVLFQRFGNLVLDDVRIGTRVRARYGDDGIVHRRIFADSQIVVADDAEQQDDDGQYR